MATLESFLPYVLPFVSGCPEPVVVDAIRNACIKFCNDTKLIRETVPASDIIVDVADYTISASENNETAEIIYLLYNERLLCKKTEEDLDISDYGWRTAESGVATSYMAPTPDRILLNRIPEETIVGGMIVGIATRPTDTTVEVNDLLFSDWRQIIKHGALSELHEMAGKGWSDMNLSISHGRKFNNGIQQGRAKATTGNLTKSTRAKPVAWV